MSEFTLQCARAFEALIDLRDSPSDAPIPEEIKPHTHYHDEAITRAQKRLKRLQSLSAKQIEADYHRYLRDTEAFHLSSAERRELMRQPYEAMITKVKRWSPPTRDHEGLKAFMLEQLRESIRFDCAPGPKPMKPKPKATWHRERVAIARRDIAYHKSERDDEIERAAERTRWIKMLRASLAALNENGD